MADVLEVRGLDILHQELQKAKDNLKDVDENIKRITGRDDIGFKPDQQRRVVRADDDRSRDRGRLNRLIGHNFPEGGPGSGGPATKRLAVGGGVIGRMGARMGRVERREQDSPDEDELLHKPTVLSLVTATPKDTRSRAEVISEQNKDNEGKARNKRMFGLLMGTLQRFKVEENKKTDKEKQRQAVEMKLEEKAKAEAVEAQNHRRKLFVDRKAQQSRVRLLEQKLELVDIHEQWAAQTRSLMPFNRTDSKPHIFYIPKIHTAQTQEKLAQSKQLLTNIIEERRRQLENDIAAITSLESRQETDVGNNENIDTTNIKQEKDTSKNTVDENAEFEEEDAEGIVVDTGNQVVVKVEREKKSKKVRHHEKKQSHRRDERSDDERHRRHHHQSGKHRSGKRHGSRETARHSREEPNKKKPDREGVVAEDGRARTSNGDVEVIDSSRGSDVVDKEQQLDMTDSAAELNRTEQSMTVDEN